MTKGITEEQRAEIEEMGRWAHRVRPVQPASCSTTSCWATRAYLDLILGDVYTHQTYYMGMVDENNKVNFYDGKVSVVDPGRQGIGKYAPNEYTDWIAEHVEPWTYLKFPYLKKVGWKGFVDGKDSGVYMATPLSRLNAADGMATPLAQEEYEKFYEHAGRQAGASAPGHPLGAADRTALRRRALGGTGDRSGDHLAELPHHADRDADRRRGHRRSAARHADASLLDRRARAC